MSKKKPNIGIVTFPIHEAHLTPLSNFADIFGSLSNDLYIITGNAGAVLSHGRNRLHLYSISHKTGANLVTRVTNYIYTQLRICYQLAKIRRKVDLWVFPIGGEALLLPMLTAKLLRKRALLALSTSAAKLLEPKKEPFAKLLVIVVEMNRILADRIILYSSSLIREWNLEKYKHKIAIAHKHFLDFDKFQMKRELAERESLVGYIGRFSEEKGVSNLVKAIPMINGEAKFLIAGEGQLRDDIKKCLNEDKLNDRTNLVGWIQHDELPNYLNRLKLLVLPSYIEGLPNIMLEAMACGTPVLATAVGSIPELIKDNETGFIMEDNSPECIARNITRALGHPNLEGIAQDARALVEKEFTFEAAVEAYKKILSSILRGNSKRD